MKMNLLLFLSNYFFLSLGMCLSICDTPKNFEMIIFWQAFETMTFTRSFPLHVVLVGVLDLKDLE